MDVYKNLNDEINENGNGGRHERSTDSDEGDNFITDIDKAAIEQSDIITTFLNKSKIFLGGFSIFAGSQVSICPIYNITKSNKRVKFTFYFPNFSFWQKIT